MSTGPSYRVALRRRREGKTDYQLRRGLILSRLPRFVVRGSLRRLSIQVIKAEVRGDKVMASADSAELTRQYGWLGDTGNISAAYLTGLLCGFKSVAKGVNEAVLDIGLHYPSKSSRVFAALKGALDAGLKIPFDKKKLPDDKTVMGAHIAEYAKRLSSNPEAYQKQFNAQLARGLKPEDINSHFLTVKEKITLSLSKTAALGISKEKTEAKAQESEGPVEEESTEED